MWSQMCFQSDSGLSKANTGLRVASLYEVMIGMTNIMNSN